MAGLKKFLKKAEKVGSKLSKAVPGVGVVVAKKKINKVRKSIPSRFGLKTKR